MVNATARWYNRAQSVVGLTSIDRCDGLGLRREGSPIGAAAVGFHSARDAARARVSNLAHSGGPGSAYEDRCVKIRLARRELRPNGLVATHNLLRVLAIASQEISAPRFHSRIHQP